MKNYNACNKCPFTIGRQPCCKTSKYCPAETCKSARYRLTGKAILTDIVDDIRYYDDEVENILTGEKMGRSEDACANEMFGETDNYIYLPPYLVDGKIVSVDWENTD